MGRVKKHIPSYSFWDLDTGKKIHAQYYIFREMGYADLIKKPFKINHFAIRWIKRGRGKVMVDHIPLVLSENLLFMGNPSQITQYNLALEGDLEALIIAFTDELLSLMGFEQEGISLIYQLSNELELYPEGHDKFMLNQIFINLC